MKHKKTFTFALIVVASVLVGAAGTYGYVRSAYLARHPHTHYHANLAIYANGQRIDLSGPKYMEDIGSCSVGQKTNARERTHLHSGVASVVHVHDDHVTWADFLKNIGFFADRTRLLTDATTYTQGDEEAVHFILNGKAVDDPTNQFIGDEDRLLISFGSEKESELITTQYAQVKATAAEYNHNDDPATCKGYDHNTGLKFWE